MTYSQQSELVDGIDQGTSITYLDQFTSRAVSDEMRLHSLTTCHTEGKIIDKQFQMIFDPNQSIDVKAYDMEN